MNIAPKTKFKIVGYIESPVQSSSITGKVNLNLANSLSASTDIINGNFSFDVDGLNEGKYTAEIRYEGSDIYEPVTGNFTVNIVRSNSTIGNVNMYPHVGGIASNVTIIADVLVCPLKDSACLSPVYPVSGLNVAFFIGKTSIGSSKTENGKAVWSFRPKTVGLGIGTYDVGISVTGNEQFKDVVLSLPGALRVTLSPIEIEMKEITDAKVGSVIKISGKITSYKNPISAQIVVKINESVNRITAKRDGTFEVPFVPSTAGIYTVLVDVSATSEYEQMSTSSIVQVSPAESVLTTKLPETVKVGEKFRLSGTLSDVLLKGFQGDIFVSIKGPHQLDEGSVPTNKHGVFNFDVTLLEEGLYTINLIYHGNEAYSPVNLTYELEAI